MKAKRSISYALISGLLVVSVLQGCSDDDDGNPTPPDVTTAGKQAIGGEGGSSGGSGNKAGTKATPDGGTGTTDGGAPPETPVGGRGGEGGAGPGEPACDLPELGTDGCFNCPKNGEVEQWLNRCVDSDCVPFDNAERLPLLEADGSLPALPN